MHTLAKQYCSSHRCGDFTSIDKGALLAITKKHSGGRGRWKEREKILAVDSI